MGKFVITISGAMAVLFGFATITVNLYGGNIYIAAGCMIGFGLIAVLSARTTDVEIPKVKN